jgi:hypothetical protein
MSLALTRRFRNYPTCESETSSVRGQERCSSADALLLDQSQRLVDDTSKVGV